MSYKEFFGIEDLEELFIIECDREGIDISDCDNVDPNIDYLCAACLDLLKDPIKLSCGHTFCRNCTFRNGYCSICRLYQGIPQQNSQMSVEIAKLTVKCNKCRTTHSLMNSECFTKYLCRVCFMYIPKKKRLAHIVNDDKYIKKCRYCSKYVYSYSHNSHELECNCAPIFCHKCMQNVEMRKFSSHICDIKAITCPTCKGLYPTELSAHELRCKAKFTKKEHKMNRRY
jgi:hypothetical protein